MSSDAFLSRSCRVCGRPTPNLGSAAVEPPVCSDCEDSSSRETQVLPEPVWNAVDVARRESGKIDSGAVLARRFEVARLLGSGGMGEVFEAEDRILGGRVAVKVVHSQRAGSNEDIRRLRREVQIARRVTHSNVCRIFDLIQHVDEDSGEALDLISMELLDGETLADRQERVGRFEVDEVLPIFRQIARGLHAAHRYGVVHRDLKPGNVMLVEEADGLRAVVTDFGLARRVGVEGLSDPDLTQSGQLIGTPAYMAPEQASSEPTTAGTDIYAFGVMLFEMLSGRLPFSGDSPWMMMIRRLTEDPLPLAELRPDLEPQIPEVVDRCLRRQPSDRFETMAEILTALDFGDSVWDVYGRKGVTPTPREPRSDATDSESMPTAGSPTAKGPTARPWWPWAAAVVAILGLTIVALLGPRSSDGTAEAIERTPAGSGASEATVSDPASGRPEGLDWDRLQAEALAQSSRQIAPSLLDAAGTPRDAPRPDDAIALANQHLAIYAADEAEGVLRAALVAEPRNPRLLGDLAWAQWRQGRDAEAQVTLEWALESAGTLPPRDRLRLEGLRHGLAGAWPLAAESFADLWTLEPNDPEHAFLILEAHWLAGRAEAVVNLLTALDDLSERRIDEQPDLESRLRPRIDLWRARFAGPAGRVLDKRRLAERAAAAAEAAGYRFVQLEALRTLARVQSLEGEGEGYEETVEVFGRLARDSTEPLYLAYSHLIEAHWLDEVGRESEALAAVRRAEEAFVGLGSRYGECRARWQLGQFHTLAPEVVVGHLDRALEVCRAGGFGLEENLVLRSLGFAWRQRGDLERAIGLYRESEEGLESLGQGRELVTSRVTIARLLGYLGHSEEMVETLQLVDPWLRETSNNRKLVISLTAGASGLIGAARLDQASTRLDQAAALDPLGARRLDLQTARCELAFARGDGEALLREAEELASLADRVGDPGRRVVARGYHALGLDLAGYEAELRGAVVSLDRDASAFELAWLRRHQRDATARAAVEHYEAQARARNHRPSLWRARALAARVDPPAVTAEGVAELLDLEQGIEPTGSRRILAEVRLARALLSNDPGLLHEVRDTAAELGLGYLVRDAERALGSPSGPSTH